MAGVGAREDIAVGDGGPGVVEGAFEFDGSDEEAGHIAAVGELAAGGDFADAGEVVDVIFFHVGTGEVTDGAFEDEAGEFIAGDGLGGADGGEGAAAVAAEAEVDSEPGPARKRAVSAWVGGRGVKTMRSRSAMPESSVRRVKGPAGRRRTRKAGCLRVPEKRRSAMSRVSSEGFSGGGLTNSRPGWRRAWISDSARARR